MSANDERPDPRDIDDAYLFCTITHFHALKFVGRFPARAGLRIVKWRCVNCKSFRTDVFNAAGRRVGKPTYDRPKDYPKVKPEREAAVVELIRRYPMSEGA